MVSCTAPVPAPQPAVPPRVEPAVEESFAAMEEAIIASVNRRRREAGLAALVAEPRLARAARLHAGNMAARRELSHTITGSTTSTLVSRVMDVGYVYSAIAENIAYGPLTVEPLVDGWVRSPAHRANMLNGNYTETGVGVARARNGDLYFCQVFGRPRLDL